jgi:hypothetical protein
MTWLDSQLERGATLGHREKLITPASTPIPGAVFDKMQNFAMSLWQDSVAKLILGLGVLFRFREDESVRAVFDHLRENGDDNATLSELAVMLGIKRSVGRTQFNATLTRAVLKAQLKPPRRTRENVPMTPEMVFDMFECFLADENKKIFGRALTAAQPGDDMDIQIL